MAKFQDEFEVVRLFYERLLKTVVEKHSIAKTKELHLLLNKFAELELAKLELYKLAVKAEAQQREYELKLKSGRPMELLQIEIGNTLQKIAFKESCLQEYKSAIAKYLKRI